MITRLLKTAMVFIVVAAHFVAPACAPAQLAENWEELLPHSGQSIFDQIHRQEVVEMTLTADLDTLIHVRNSHDYRDASITYKDENGIVHNYLAKVKPRGKFRRRVCDFPPLKLKFSKDQLEAAGLSKHNDLKLVTHCLDQEPYDESLVMREYLAYKMYNELTPNSFRVQLVKITYIDRKNTEIQTTHYGFLIEDVDEMAERMGGKECDDCFGLPRELIHTSQERIASMFQYLIGNTDWNIQMTRNVKMVRMEDGVHIPVPYDFDFSVLVSAPYLRPNKDVRQTTEMERIYMGFAESHDDIYSTLSYYKTKKNALLNLVKGFDLIDTENRRAILSYIESYYDAIEKLETKPMIFREMQIPGKG